MFSQACVKNSVNREMYPSIHFDRHPLWGMHWGRQTFPGRHTGVGVYPSMHWSRHPLGKHSPQGRHPPSRQTPPAQGMLGYTLPLPSACWDTHPPDGHCSGRYTSYWNAFLFLRINLNKMCHLQQNKRSPLFLLVETSYKPTC